jgi:hypothetical protein
MLEWKGNKMAASCLLFSWKSARSYKTIYYTNSSKWQNENLQHTLPPFIFLAQMVIKYPTDYTTNIKKKILLREQAK